MSRKAEIRVGHKGQSLHTNRAALQGFVRQDYLPVLIVRPPPIVVRASLMKAKPRDICVVGAFRMLLITMFDERTVRGNAPTKAVVSSPLPFRHVNRFIIGSSPSSKKGS